MASHKLAIATPREAEAVHSYLLSMPPEIRNIIYDKALESLDCENIDLISIQIIQDNRKCMHGPPTETNDDHPSPWKLLSLTQTCRQIRHEFRPMLQAHFHVTVEVNDAQKYIHDFVLPGATKAEEAVAELTIITRGCSRYELDGLIETLQFSPGIKLKTDMGILSDEDCEAIFHAREARPDWWRYYKERVDRVHIVQLCPYEARLCVMIRDKYVKKWMHGTQKIQWRGGKRKVKATEKLLQEWGLKLTLPVLIFPEEQCLPRNAFEWFN